jgi:ureidoglycolate lyase
VITAVPLTAAAFAPFGQVIERPADFGRIYFSDALASGRPSAKGSLSLTKARPLATPNLVATKMERHEFSSQSFVPLDVSRYLVVVAPQNADGKLDHSRLLAFVARGDQGVTYGMNVWHHPLCVLDRPGQFAVFMWLDGGKGDEEFVDLPTPQAIMFSAPTAS